MVSRLHKEGYMLLVYFVLSLAAWIAAFSTSWVAVVGLLALGIMNAYILGRHDDLFGLYDLYDDSTYYFGIDMNRTWISISAMIMPVGFFFSIPQFITNIGKTRKDSTDRQLRSPTYRCPDCKRYVTENDKMCLRLSCSADRYDV